MTSEAVPQLTDRQARAVIAVAESHGFERDPYLLWWRYDNDLHTDAVSALEFLRQRHPECVGQALAADDPMPVWVAVERIMDERGGVDGEQVDQLNAAAVQAGLMDREVVDGALWPADEWHVARKAVEQLWQSDFQRLKEILGDHVTLAMVPDTALYPCPSVCDGGYVPYKFAGEMPAERPQHWFASH